jgi:hypothetical protein
MTSASDASMTAVFRMVDLAVFLKAKGRSSEVLLKFNLRVGFGRKVFVWNFCFGIFQIDFASGPPSGDLLFRPGLLVSPLVCTVSAFFFLSLSLLCVQSLLRWSITSRCNGRVFSLLLELQHKFGPQMVLATGLYALRGDDEISCELCDG